MRVPTPGDASTMIGSLTPVLSQREREQDQFTTGSASKLLAFFVVNSRVRL